MLAVWTALMPRIVDTDAGPLLGRTVVACAGLQADLLAAAARPHAIFPLLFAILVWVAGLGAIAPKLEGNPIPTI